MRENSFPSTSTLLTGALIAGGLALLASPRTGPQLRGQIRDLAEGLSGGAMARTMAKRLDVAMERGIEYAERGQQVLRQASDAIDHAIERGKDYLESGKGMVNSVGRQQDSGWSNGSGFAAAGALLAGALIGGGLALLMTPQTGTEFRRQIKTYAGKVRRYGEKAAEQAKGEMAMVRER